MRALMALIQAGFGQKSAEFAAVKKRGTRNGKHSGSCPGAFGGRFTAKAHRQLYLQPSAAK